MCGGTALCGISVCDVPYAWGLEDVPVGLWVSTNAGGHIGVVDGSLLTLERLCRQFWETQMKRQRQRRRQWQRYGE
jgi:hypothetical protein